MKIKFSVLLVTLFTTGLIICSFTFQTGKPWNIPEKYIKMKSNVKSDESTVKVGKAIWEKQCKACHGSSGKGDGSKAKMLKTNPGDFTTAAVQNQKDGELYYESFLGRGEMPNFEKKIPDESDRWSVVNYIRTLKK